MKSNGPGGTSGAYTTCCEERLVLLRVPNPAPGALLACLTLLILALPGARDHLAAAREFTFCILCVCVCVCVCVYVCMCTVCSVHSPQLKLSHHRKGSCSGWSYCFSIRSGSTCNSALRCSPHLLIIDNFNGNNINNLY